MQWYKIFSCDSSFAEEASFLGYDAALREWCHMFQNICLYCQGQADIEEELCWKIGCIRLVIGLTNGQGGWQTIVGGNGRGFGVVAGRFGVKVNKVWNEIN